MKKMNEQMARLYEAARLTGRLDRSAEQASMARLLNVGSQNVNNWEKRGPSKEGALQAQETLDINATWVLTGNGPMFIGQSQETKGPHEWPFARITPDRIHALPSENRAEIEEHILLFIERFEKRSAKKSVTKSGVAAA